MKRAVLCADAQHPQFADLERSDRTLPSASTDDIPGSISRHSRTRDDTICRSSDISRMSVAMRRSDRTPPLVQRNGEVVQGRRQGHQGSFFHPNAEAMTSAHVIQQNRPGSHHGRGGRPRGSTRKCTVGDVLLQVESIICHTIVQRIQGREDGYFEAFSNALHSDPHLDSSWTWDSDIATRQHARLQELYPSIKHRGYFSIPGPVMAVCSIVMTASVTGVRLGNVMDKHSHCFWIDEAGDAFCTCYGSTRFRIIFGRLSQPAVHDFEPCVHLTGIESFLGKVSVVLGIPIKAYARAMAKGFAAISSMCLSELALAAPVVHSIIERQGVHTLYVIVEKEVLSHQFHYIPVRMLLKGHSVLICSFCDNLGKNNCHRVNAVRSSISGHLASDSTGGIPSATASDEEAPADENHDFSNQPGVSGPNNEGGSYMTPTEEIHAVSHLPLSPVNCNASLRVEESVRRLVTSGGIFLAAAPQRCLKSNCDGVPDPKTRSILTDGVLMCSSGPCTFHYEKFKCALCHEEIASEGRDSYIVIDSVSSAATHAWLRTELTGVVLCNGTLSGRLRHYHGQVSTLIQHGIVPSAVKCRSVQTLRRLCTIMLKLMCLKPPPELFICETCEYDGNHRKQRLDSLCMDGINQGHLLKCKRPFRNISQVCKPKKPGKATGPRSENVRPLDTLFRGTHVLKILFQAITGEEIVCLSNNVYHVSAAVRVVNAGILPRFFCMSSICGRSSNSYLDDIGEKAPLVAARRLITALFDSNVLLKRLLTPLQSFTERCSSEEVQALGGQMVPRSSDRRRRGMRGALEVICETVENLGNIGLNYGHICWIDNFGSADRYLTDDVYRLIRMLLQGPVTQILHKKEIASAEWFASFCSLPNPDLVLQCLRSDTFLPSQHGSTPHVATTSFLSRCVVLQAGIKSVTDLEGLGYQSACNARKAIAEVIRSSAECVHQFYRFYESGRGTASATLYASEWGSRDSNVLRQKMATVHGTHRAQNGNAFDIACTTGFFFPHRDQIRPLPFNDEEFNLSDNEDDEGYCSKNYIQRQKSYTPGCITFVCSCSHPLILGLKAIHRDEGPRVVLDSLLSRFPTPPRYVIYDFGCGLYNSARHSLWWALEDTCVVSDYFHSKNHTCSPAFEPGTHAHVAMTNTVAHEQRNRAIQQLARTLRNSSQEFYISILAFQTSILNIQARAKSSYSFHTRPHSVSPYDLAWAFFSCLKLSCLCCVQRQ